VCLWRLNSLRIHIVSLIACVSDPKAARDIVFGPDGILQYVTPKKAYVDMSTVDPQTAQDISAAIKAKGGRYLEAPVSGSKRPAEAGEVNTWIF